MTNTTLNTTATMNKNLPGLRKKAIEYKIANAENMSYEELSVEVEKYEARVMKVLNGLVNTPISDNEVKELNVEQLKARKIIKSMGDDFTYALGLYAKQIGDDEILSRDYRSFDYELVKEIRDLYYEKITWKAQPKRGNWSCVQVSINNLDTTNSFNSLEAVDVTDFDNKYEAGASGKPIRVPISITRAKKVADSLGKGLLVVKMVPNDGPFADTILANLLSDCTPDDSQDILQDKCRSILKDGIIDNATGKKYLVAVRSAAQARTGSFWFFEADNFDEVDEFRRLCCCVSKKQWSKIFKDKVYMSKMEARIGLSVSSALDVKEVTKACREQNFIDVINGFNVKVIPDVYNEIHVETVEPCFNAQGIFEGHMTAPTLKKIENNASDGCGLISVRATIQCNYALNLISHKDYIRAIKLFERYDSSLSTFKSKEPLDGDSEAFRDYQWFESFVLRLHKVLQFRHAGDKGILVMADLEHYGVAEDILIHESTRKYDFGDWADAPFEICNYGKHKTGMANMNFQFWNSLDISNEDVKSIVDESLEYINHGVMEDPVQAMKFLGMVSRIGEDDADEDKVTIKLNKTLSTDPEMIRDVQVQRWLYQKVEKFIDDLSIGRVPIEGAFYYIVTDPRYLLKNYLKSIGVEADIDFLQSGENYLNGKEGDAAAFRSPLVHGSEARKLHCIADDGLWFYTDLLILNPFDGTAAAAGGADFDGDIMLATFDGRIVRAVRNYGFIIYDEGVKADMVKNNWKNRIDFFVKTSVRDKTGYITNIATRWADLAHNWRLANKMDKCHSYQNAVIALRFLQGWEIDSAKTGKNADAMGFPEALKQKKTPHWFVGMRDIQGRKLNVKPENVYCSRAALGFLFDYVREYRKNHILAEGKTQSRTVYLGKRLSEAELEVTGQLVPHVREIEHSYRKEVAIISGAYRDGIVDKGVFLTTMAAISEKYNHLLMSLVDINRGITEYAVVYTAYFVTYNRDNHESKSYSFPWTCMFDSMIRLFYKGNKSMGLYRLPAIEIEDLEVRNRELYVNGKSFGEVPCSKNMKLAVTTIDGKPFVVVPKDPKIDTEESQRDRQIISSSKTYNLELNGFRFTDVKHCENFLQLVKANNNCFDIIEQDNVLKIKIGQWIVASVASKYVIPSIINTRVHLVSHGNTTYTPKRISKTTIMKDDTTAYTGQLSVDFFVIDYIGEESGAEREVNGNEIVRSYEIKTTVSQNSNEPIPCPVDDFYIPDYTDDDMDYYDMGDYDSAGMAEEDMIPDMSNFIILD